MDLWIPIVDPAYRSSQHQPILSSLLDDLTNRGLALSSYEALPLALHQLLQITPHHHLLHVGAVALPHQLLLLTQLLESTKEKNDKKEEEKKTFK